MVALGLALAQTIQAQPQPQAQDQPQPQPQAQPTAFALVGKANNYVGIQSKDKILEIESDKSVGSLEPNIWRVVFYDPDSAMRSVEVRFGGNQEMDVSHPLRPFQMARNANDILERDKLKVDSDEALHTAMQQSLLKPLRLRASKLTLSRTDIGPAWKVQFWAARGGSSHDVDIGSVTISAVDGSILRSDLHPSRAQ